MPDEAILRTFETVKKIQALDIPETQKEDVIRTLLGYSPELGDVSDSALRKALLSVIQALRVGHALQFKGAYMASALERLLLGHGINRGDAKRDEWSEDQPDLQLVALCQDVQNLAEDGKEHLNQGSPTRAASCLQEIGGSMREIAGLRHWVDCTW